MSPCRLSRLVVNYIVVYDFRSSATNVIHLSNPLHLIVCFEFFCHALTLCHLFYEPKKHILSLLIYIGKVSVQFAFCEQGRIKTFAVRLDILYESGSRTPKADLTENLAGVLGVSPLALSVPDIDS